MYKSKSLRPLDGEKCFKCKFCVWDEDRQEEHCENFRCYEYSDFVEFDAVEVKRDGRRYQ